MPQIRSDKDFWQIEVILSEKKTLWQQYPKYLFPKPNIWKPKGRRREKNEYYKGEVFAMAGATREHNKIVASLVSSIGQHLKGKRCSFFPSDLRVYNPVNTLYTYPDAIVVCGQEEYLDNKFDTLLNPTVVFEVLSLSTENYDRGTKFMLYRSIPSLKNYVLISSSEFDVDVYERQDGDRWLLTTAKGKESSIYISAIDYHLPLADVYAQIDSFE